MAQTTLLQIPSAGIAGSTSAQSYTRYNFIYTATSATTYISFEFQQDPQFFALDSASFTNSSGVQLLQNGGFELGTYAGWTNFSPPNVSSGGVVNSGTAGTTTSNSQAGSYYWVDGSVGGVDGLVQGVPTTAGQTYTLSFWLANDGGGPALFKTIVGDSPTISLSINNTVANQATTDAAALTPFSQVSVTDSLSGQTETVSVRPSTPANGSLSDPNATTTGGTFTSGAYRVTGTPAQVTAALRGLVYTPAGNRVAAGQAVSTDFTIEVVDTAGNTARNMTTSVTATAVNDAPALGGTVAGQVATSGVALNPFATVTVTDPDVGATEAVTITLRDGNGTATDANGSLGGTGLIRTGAGTYVLASGTPAAVQSALRAIRFTPTANQAPPGTTITTALTLSVSDGTAPAAVDGTTTVVAGNRHPAVVTGITASPADAVLGVGGQATLMIAFSRSVVVGGTGLLLALNDGGTAVYVGGSGTSALSFVHTAAAGQDAGDLAATGLILRGATVRDVDGNDAMLSSAAANPPGTLAVDTTPPAAPVGLGLDPVSDTGASNADGVTRVTAPTLTGTAEAGSLVVVTDGTGVGAVVIATATAGLNGAWSATSATLAEGVHQLAATATDAAGNTSAASQTVAVTVKATTPVVTLALSNDTGASAADGVTSSASLTGTAEANGTVTVLDGATVLGSTTADGQGRWGYTPTLAGGHHTLTAHQTDQAGNMGSSAALAVTLDTTAPVVTLALSNDTGASATDRVTRDPALTGTAEPDGTVTVLDGTVVLGTAAVDAGGRWTLTPTLGDGMHTLTATQADAAGNTGSAALAFTLDRAAPTATLSPLDPADASAATVRYALTLSEPVSGLDAGDFRVRRTGSLSGPAGTGLVQVDATHYTVSVAIAATGEGLVAPTLAAAGSGVADPAGNLLAADADGAAIAIARNRPPTPVADSGSAPLYHVVTGNVLANDGGLDVGGTLRVTSVRFAGGAAVAVPASGGAIVPADGGHLLIDAAGNYAFTAQAVAGAGTLPFAYTVANGQGATATAELVVQVTEAVPAAQQAFGFAFADSTVRFLPGQVLLAGPDGSLADVTGAGALALGDGTIQRQVAAPLVDPLYYYATNPDVWQAYVGSGLDAGQHYAQYGWREGRDPNALFSTRAYLAANPDVVQAGMDPLQHYAQYGWKEGRAGVPGFSAEAYRAANPDVARVGMDPLAHYLAYGMAEGRYAFAGLGADGALGSFDAQFYLAGNSDVAAAAPSGRSAASFALEHYLQHGWHEGRDPSALFSTSYYLRQNPDVGQAGLDPLLHYEQYGWREGRDPGPDFSTVGYLSRNPDVTAARIDPLQHYLEYGIAEGRLPTGA